MKLTLYLIINIDIFLTMPSITIAYQITTLYIIIFIIKVIFLLSLQKLKGILFKIEKYKNLCYILLTL